MEKEVQFISLISDLKCMVKLIQPLKLIRHLLLGSVMLLCLFFVMQTILAVKRQSICMTVFRSIGFSKMAIASCENDFYYADSGGDMALALQLQEEENLRQQEFIAQQQRYNQQQANIPQTQPASNAPSKKEAKAEARDFRRRKGRQDPSASTNPKDGRGKQQNSKSKDERCCIQ